MSLTNILTDRGQYQEKNVDIYHGLLGFGSSLTLCWLRSNPSFFIAGFSLLTSGQSRTREGAAENISESFPNGEHNPAADESQLLPNGKLRHCQAA